MNNAFAQNKHTIPIYSFEPPTALKNGGVFLNKNAEKKTMKIFYIFIIPLLYTTSANALCASDTETTTEIPNGKIVRRDCAYVAPNCSGTCPCCRTSPVYTCTCNSGYYATGGGTTNCTCNACPDNSTCTSATSFTCNIGYYKNGVVCSRCPSSYGVNGTTTRGATSITKCYLPSGTNGSDTTGDFTHNDNCYYTE